MPVQSELLKKINKGRLKFFCSRLNIPQANNSINVGGRVLFSILDIGVTLGFHPL